MVSNYCKILNTYISAVNMSETVEFLIKHIGEHRGEYVCVANVHTTVMAYYDRSYRRIQNESLLTLPDGNPIAKACRKCGYTDVSRVTGPDLMTELFQVSATNGLRHFFYGSTYEILNILKEKLQRTYPGINIVGMYSPPFRNLTNEEELADVEMINESHPDYVWISLGAPKQEQWMYRHKGEVNGIMIGVGAGIDFHAGVIRRAPDWMQRNSLEWLYRLLQDPQRLWKRYFKTNLYFITKCITKKIYQIPDSNKTADDKEANKLQNSQHVFIVGSKGIPAKYGGFETFVDKLTEHRKNTHIHYHVSCLDNTYKVVKYHNARCYHIRVPEKLGAAKAVYYDYVAVMLAIRYINKKNIENPIIYILACRIGPVMHYLSKRIHDLGGVVYVNPDGHEWKRSKWNWWIKQYWKISERLMVKNADLLICDAKLIEEYIKKTYNRYHPNTVFIPYGADIENNLSEKQKEKAKKWMKDKGVIPNEYYLIVGRFVPENNYFTMISEFMKSRTQKDLVIVTNIAEGRLYKQLREKLHFERDSRIKFVGSVYENDTLQYIRLNAFAYLHGHEVGGTNPSLLEALGMTRLNLLYDVGFNKDVAGDAALYWNKRVDNLCNLMLTCECMDEDRIAHLGLRAKAVINKNYLWNQITDQYEAIFIE